MTVPDIETKFPGEIDAIIYFEHLRWGNVIKCAYCNTEKVSKRQHDNRFHCSQCRRTFSVTTGTYMHSSKLPLKIWMNAFSMLSDNEKLSIKHLQHSLNVSYTTAWRIRHGINEIMKIDFKEDAGTMFESLCKRAISAYNPPDLQKAVV